jgi:hypothetical protein
MKNASTLNYYIISAGCVLIVSSALAGCGRSNDQAAANDTTITQTNNVTMMDTNTPATNAPSTDAGTTSTSSSASSGMTPNTPTGGPSTGVPVPQDSSRVNHAGTTESTTVAPGSENARADTNAAPASESGGAPSQKSK